MDNFATKGSKKATTSQQFEMLVTEVKMIPEIANNMPLVGENRAKVENAWESIAVKLNSIGPPVRKTGEWRKVWTDLRNRTKKKLQANIIETAGDAFTANELNNIEQPGDRLLHMREDDVTTGVCYGMNSAFMSASPQTPPESSQTIALAQWPELPLAVEIDITSPSASQEPVYATPQLEPTNNDRKRAKKRRRSHQEHLDLFKQQIELQKQQVAVFTKLVEAVEKQAEATNQILVILKERNG